MDHDLYMYCDESAALAGAAQQGAAVISSCFYTAYSNRVWKGRAITCNNVQPRSPGRRNTSQRGTEYKNSLSFLNNTRI